MLCAKLDIQKSRELNQLFPAELENLRYLQTIVMTYRDWHILESELITQIV